MTQTQTHRHTQTHTDTHSHTQTHGDTPTHTGTHTDTHKHTQTHTDTQTHTQTHRHTHTQRRKRRRHAENFCAAALASVGCCGRSLASPCRFQGLKVRRPPAACRNCGSAHRRTPSTEAPRATSTTSSPSTRCHEGLPHQPRPLQWRFIFVWLKVRTISAASTVADGCFHFSVRPTKMDVMDSESGTMRPTEREREREREREKT